MIDRETDDSHTNCWLPELDDLCQKGIVGILVLVANILFNHCKGPTEKSVSFGKCALLPKDYFLMQRNQRSKFPGNSSYSLSCLQSTASQWWWQITAISERTWLGIPRTTFSSRSRAIVVTGEDELEKSRNLQKTFWGLTRTTLLQIQRLIQPGTSVFVSLSFFKWAFPGLFLDDNW